MGRPRGTAAKKDSTKELDSKSKAIEKPSRATREKVRKSYREMEGSDSDIDFGAHPSSPEEVPVGGSESEDFGGDSSGSEYGKKKKVAAKGRGKASPSKKAPAKRGRKPGPGRKPAAKPAASPAKRGRKPGTKAATNGKKKAVAESSGSEEDEKVQSSEDELSEENSESDFGEGSSGSDYGKKGKKAKKEKTPTRSQPKRTAAPPAKKRGRKPKAETSTNGSKKAKLDEDVEDKSDDDGMKIDEDTHSEENEDVKSEEEKVEKKKEAPKAKPEPKKPAAKAVEKSSEEDSEEVEEEEEDDEVEKKKPSTKESEKKPEPAKAKAKDEEKSDLDEEEEEEDEDEKEEKDKESAAPGLKNRTDTDLSKLDFKCEKKSSKGEESNFKIVCWNIGGIKSFVKKSGLDYVKAENPDILCLQEIKCTDKTRPAEVEKVENYPHTYWSYAEQAGHHGVATFSKVEPASVSYGLPVGDGDSDEDKKLKESFNKEGRLIVTEYEKFYLLNAYVPNSGRATKDDGAKKLYPPKITSGERQNWDRLFRNYVKELDAKKPVVLCGDLNVAHEEIDLANPKTNTSTAGFTKEERDGMTTFLKETKLFDSFRSLYPDEKGAYTFWSYMNNARGKNVGWRLDYFLVSEQLKEAVVENTMRKEVYGSDHCPIVLFTHF